jgi:hypothetical protein
MKGFSAQTELVVIVIAFMLLFGFLTNACNPFESEPSPREDAEHDCEVAYEEARDGDGDDPEAIVDQEWCQEHNAAQEQIAVMEEQMELQQAQEEQMEQQIELQEAQAP